MTESAERLLGTAERIIQCLDDGSTYERYKRVKEKIMSKYEARSPMEAHIKASIKENRDLSRKMNDMKEGLSRNVSLEEYVIEEMVEIARHAIPNVEIPQIDRIDGSCNFVYSVIESKCESISLFQRSISERNSHLREKMNQMSEFIARQISSIETGLETFRNQKIADTKPISDSLKQSKSEIDRIKAELSHLNDGSRIEDEEIALKKGSARPIIKAYKKSERKREKVESRLKTLRSQASDLHEEIERSVSEIKKQKISQKYGFSENDLTKIEELNRAEAELSELSQRNRLLASELKKRRLISSCGQ